ncbi:hypothetical protein [Phycicoccus avicenniae]|uniref:hypothetical protein n=1 Tax=Phycicoccus avicenniae TaxID=2828860 RepID=UPI003D2B843D
MEGINVMPPSLKVAFVGWCPEADGRMTLACSAYDDNDRNWQIGVNSPDRAAAMRALKAVGLHGLSKARTSQFAPSDELRRRAVADADFVVFLPREVH